MRKTANKRTTITIHPSAQKLTLRKGTDKHIWAIGEITGNLYPKDEAELYRYRRNVIWYKVIRLSYDSFPDSLKNKLRNPHTIMPLEKNDWETIIASI